GLPALPFTNDLCVRLEYPDDLLGGISSRLQKCAILSDDKTHSARHGLELLAQLLHAPRPRREKPLTSSRTFRVSLRICRVTCRSSPYSRLRFSSPSVFYVVKHVPSRLPA